MKKLYSLYSKKKKVREREIEGSIFIILNVKVRFSKVVGIFQFAFLHMLE